MFNSPSEGPLRLGLLIFYDGYDEGGQLINLTPTEKGQLRREGSDHFGVKKQLMLILK